MKTGLIISLSLILILLVGLLVAFLIRLYQKDSGFRYMEKLAKITKECSDKELYMTKKEKEVEKAKSYLYEKCWYRMQISKNKNVYLVSFDKDSILPMFQKVDGKWIPVSNIDKTTIEIDKAIKLINGD